MGSELIPLTEFWGDNYYKHPPLTDEMVTEAERQLGVTLPEAYLALLRIQNGGYTNKFAHPMTVNTSWAPNHVSLNDLAGIVLDPDKDSPQNILKTAYMTEEWELPPNQVLLAGDGHWWIALDYRKGPEPSVAWIDVECDQDIQIAPSFSAFYTNLVPESDYEDEDEPEKPRGLLANIKNWFKK